MKPTDEVKQALYEEECIKRLSALYCCSEETAKDHADRYLHVVEGLETQYGKTPVVSLFSAPGRTEIGGNHTDHQHGCVLAGAVNIDMIAAVSPNEMNRVRLVSEGFAPCEVDLFDLEKRAEEENTTIAILRGTCRAYRDLGAKLSGFDLFVASNVPKGSGVSSSAAFEVLLGTICNELFMGEAKVDPVRIAQIGQWTENVYFGKPCGLMDQMASSVGAVVAIDFHDPQNPIVSRVPFDPVDAGLALCILDSGADHADLTDEYSAIPGECKQVAALLGAEVLRDVDEASFYENLPRLRGACSDRALLRAIHFFAENKRAQEEADALNKKDYAAFLRLVSESGDSSWEYLQNVTPAGAIDRQAVALTIAVAKKFVGEKGAVRVHGGGFAGTVQAFVPIERVEAFRTSFETVFGPHTCHVMAIRPVGGVRIL